MHSATETLIISKSYLIRSLKKCEFIDYLEIHNRTEHVEKSKGLSPEDITHVLEQIMYRLF